MTTTNSNMTTPASDFFATLGGAKSTTKTSAADDQKNTFLTLLTTQLKNQDPTNPLDNAQMTSQLAQISTVDGITQLNNTLQTLLSNNTQSQNLQAAALVGHGVLVPGSSMKLTDEGAVAGFTLEGPADVVKIEIKNAKGDVVRTIEMKNQDAGVHAFAWDGKTDLKETAANGSYTFSVKATQGTEKVTSTALAAGAVSAVVNGANGISVDVGSLGRFGTSDIKLVM